MALPDAAVTDGPPAVMSPQGQTPETPATPGTEPAEQPAASPATESTTPAPAAEPATEPPATPSITPPVTETPPATEPATPATPAVTEPATTPETTGSTSETTATTSAEPSAPAEPAEQGEVSTNPPAKPATESEAAAKPDTESPPAKPAAARGNTCLTCPFTAPDAMVDDTPSLPLLRELSPRSVARTPLTSAAEAFHPILSSWKLVTGPIWNVLQPGTGLRGSVRSILNWIWTIAVWALFGGAICRIAAVQLTIGEKVSIKDSLKFSAKKWWETFWAPLMPTAAVGLICIPLLIVGLIAKLNIGLLLIAIIWPILLLAGLIIAVLMLGLLFGWPLMWGTIATEGTDSFDALSRSYAYTFQRPLHYLFYVLVAVILGGLGWLLVSNFTSVAITMTDWGLSWGTGADRITAISDPSVTGIGAAGVAVRWFWTLLAKWLATGFLFGYFWTAVTCIYLLLRRDVDATEMDEVYLPEEEEEEEVLEMPAQSADEGDQPVKPEEAQAPTEETPPAEPEAEPKEESEPADEPQPPSDSETEEKKDE